MHLFAENAEVFRNTALSKTFGYNDLLSLEI